MSQFDLKQNVMQSSRTQGFWKQPQKLLSVVLWLTACHSFLMGIALIAQPPTIMAIVGFSRLGERFFPAQGGVFHIVMGIAYVLGAVNTEKYHELIFFAIIVKAAATLFLMLYCFAVEFKWIILLSGIGDCIMGLAILITWWNYLCYQKYSDQRHCHE